MDERLIDIEMKLSSHENLIEELSTIIYEQQKKIDKLERAMKEIENSNLLEVGSHNVKPPHY